MMVRKMTKNDLEATARLLDDYRGFYGQEADYERAYLFLKERFGKQDSIVFIAEEADELVGFTQLYPIFTTVGLNRGYLLNDLYVGKNHRQKGIASALIQKTFDYGEEQNASFVMLETAVTNTAAQKVYEKVGMQLQDGVHYFTRKLD